MINLIGILILLTIEAVIIVMFKRKYDHKLNNKDNEIAERDKTNNDIIQEIKKKNLEIKELKNEIVEITKKHNKRLRKNNKVCN